jgi:imidazolonepropionase
VSTKATSLCIRNARVLTLAGSRTRRGTALQELGVLPRADVLMEAGVIAAVGPEIPTLRPADREIDARGRVVMPGFVDCHTHACFAGSRLDEWEAKCRGATYLEIMNAGGGIMSTVRATREAGEKELAGVLRDRLRAFLRLGTTTVEVKSGYGLSTHDELKMLRAIRDAAVVEGQDRAVRLSPNVLPGVVATALLGHAIPAEAAGDPEAFVARTVSETLDAVHAEFPGVAIDAYCEQGAWSVDQCFRLFSRARSLGHAVRVHADQFNALGMVERAVALGARSVDHLEATPRESLERLARSETFGVVLPCCGFHLDGRYADARGFIDAGGLLALATNFNPGSAPCMSMPAAIALAVRQLRLTPAEAIRACTVHGAEVLGLRDRGTIEAGARADLLVLSCTDERTLAYEFGGDPVEHVVRGGEVVR